MAFPKLAFANCTLAKTAACLTLLLMAGLKPMAADASMASLDEISAPSGLVVLDDDSLSGVTGDGMTFIWTDFRMMFDPQSYMEQMGSPGSNTCSGTGQTSGNYNCWRRGDLRWYGANVSSTGGATGNGSAPAGSTWATSWTQDGTNMRQCENGGIAGLGCPRGGPIANFAAHDNPYILRVRQIGAVDEAVTYEGNTTNSQWKADGTGGVNQSVLEWLAPTSQDRYRMSFWGEIEVGRGGVGTGLLKSQTILSGNAAGSELRFFIFTQRSTSPGLASPYDPTQGCSDATCSGAATSAYLNRTLAIQYKSRLQADMRFSVAQTSGSANDANDAIGVPVDFHSTEGMYFRNANVYLPLGQPFYQALTINVPRDPNNNSEVRNGNFTLEIPLIPNRPAVFNHFYSLNTNHGNAAAPTQADLGYATARAAYLYSLPVTGSSTPAYMPARSAASITNYDVPDANYNETHGRAQWGDWFICQGIGCRYPTSPNTTAQAAAGIGRNAWNSSGDGIFFIGTQAFNAYAYRPTQVDVRNNSNEHTSISRYAVYNGCSSGYAECGYGGHYLGRGGTGNSGTNTSTTSMQRPENSWYNRASTGMGEAVSIPVINVPAGTPLNLGDARIDGIQMNYLRLTTLGATN